MADKNMETIQRVQVNGTPEGPGSWQMSALREVTTVSTQVQTEAASTVTDFTKLSFKKGNINTLVEGLTQAEITNLKNMLIELLATPLPGSETEKAPPEPEAAEAAETAGIEAEVQAAKAPKARKQPKVPKTPKQPKQPKRLMRR